MTGPWLVVKWAGISILSLYLLLLLVGIWRFRAKLSALRAGVFFWPVSIGGFVSLSGPELFENVVIARVCFVIGHLIYLVGIVLLVRGLVSKDDTSLLRVEETGERVQTLNLS